MRRWALIVVLTGVFFNTAAEVEAAPASGYNQFLQSLDSIMTGAVMPVADEAQRRLHSISLSAGQVAQIMAAARELLGQPVVWGGASLAQGFDCSGLVQYVYRQAGINLPRTADLQFQVGSTVAPTALLPGDLVYFTTYEPGASHVGIYIGNDRFIHTSFSQSKVAIGNMQDDYFLQRYYGAKRL